MGASAAVGGAGRRLDSDVRRWFEPKLGLDLGGVRVHTDSAASASARAMRAKAYTIGSEIVFSAGGYEPSTSSGRELLAHELAHVAQQSASGVFTFAAFPDLDFWDVVDVFSPIGGEIGRAANLSPSDVLEGAGRAVLGDTLFEILQAFAGGFKDGLQSAPRAQLNRLSEKFDDFGVADAFEFANGYSEGILKGLWHELRDLFEAIKTLLGLPAALRRFLTETLPELAARLGTRLAQLTAQPGGLSDRLKKLVDAFNRDPAAIMAQVDRLLDTARAAVLREIRNRGRAAAASSLAFLEEPWDEIGEDVGELTGRILFEVLLAVGTDAIGNLVKDALAIGGRIAAPVVEGAIDVVRSLGRLFGRVLEWLEALVKRVGSLGGELFDALRELVASLRNLVGELGPEMEAAGAGGPGVGVRVAETRGPTVLESRAVKPPPRTSPATVSDLKPPRTPEPKLSTTAPAAEEKGVQFELTEKRAQRLKRVAEALNDDTKWGNVTPNDRWRLGRVYDELVEKLVRAVVPTATKVEHYVAVDAASIAKLSAGRGRVLITEGKLAGGAQRFDMLEINFERREATLIDLASRPKQAHVDKLLSYRRQLEKLLGFKVEAKEMYYTDKDGKLLEDLIEVIVE